MANPHSSLAALIRSFEGAAAAGRWSDAEAIARYHLGHSSDDGKRHAWAVTALARCAIALGDRAAARRWIDRAARLVDDDARFRDHRASLLLEIGDAAAALALLEPADGDPAAHLTTGIALVLARWQAGSCDAAVALLTQLLHRHLLIAGGRLEQLTDKISAALALPGWIGHQGGGMLVGAIHPVTPTIGRIVLSGPAGAARSWPFADFRASFMGATVSRDDEHYVLPVTTAAGADPAGGPWSLRVDGRELLGSGLGQEQMLAVEGIVEIDGDRLHGWVSTPDHADLVPRLRLEDEAGNTLAVPTSRRFADDGQPRQCFAVALNAETGLRHGRLRVLAGPCDEPLAGSPVVWGHNRPPPAKRRRRQGPIAPTIDIIVPVYGGRVETLDCLQTVLAAAGNFAAELVVIDDATPDRALAAALDALAAAGRITLLRNAVNQGFPAAVRRGMALHDDRDVVLLNADTLVTGDWLRRLQRAAYGLANTGTVTPLSNDATICSYPSRDGKDGVPPSDAGAPDAGACAALDRLAARVNAGECIALPTAVGFCMYIRRDCLRETGPFSEDLFGRGYGEENDFCLRASGKGWLHMAATDVYVGHVGGKSFGRQRRLLIERNLRVLERHHPGYAARIAAFAADDPLAPARRRLDLARWQYKSARPTVLLVTLDLEGGTARHVDDRRRGLQAAGWRVLVLVPAKGQNSRLIDTDQPGLGDLRFDGATELDMLADLLTRSAVVKIEIHHSLNHHPRILDLPARLGVPFDVVIHDYHWLCPQVTLVGISGRYCGEPQLSQCERCHLALGAESGEEITVAGLRARSTALLTAAERVVVPSEDVASRYRRYFPTVSPTVQPWDDVAPSSVAIPRHPLAERRRRICVIGAVGPHKGFDVLRACAEDAARRDLPLDFVLVGYSCNDSALFATGRVFVTGRYRPEEAVDLVRRQDADWAFVPSVCPETWCYALSVAWQAGLAVAAFDLGTPAERIRANGGGAVLPLEFDPPRINDALLSLVTNDTIADISKAFNHSARSDLGMVNTKATASGSPIIATPQELALAPGFYAITVLRGGRPQQPVHMTVPSIQVTTPPVSSPLVEMLCSHAGGWLTQLGDTILLKVGGQATVLLTSYKSSQPDADALDIQISRVDAPHGAILPTPAPLPKVNVVAHIQKLGDQTFSGGDWAGAVGQNLWIEGFAIVPESGLAPEDIEYKGVAANGWETPWFTAGAFCGTRGQAVPMIGVGIRLRAAVAERFDCICEAAFVGGSRSGSSRDGAVCRSDVIGAPLEGFRLSFAAKA
jgi:GT2 family glycosyltransferase/glycosyltransferase involved in cell wall biosynthesis